MLFAVIDRMVKQALSRMGHLSLLRGSRMPDVMVVLEDRLRANRLATPDWRNKPVEVLSGTDRHADV